MNLKYITNYRVTIIIAIAIIFLSLMTSSNVPSSPLINFKGIDKIVHFMMYFSLTMVYLIEKYIYNKDKTVKIKNNFIGILLIILLGGLIEIFQPIISNRNSDFYDFIANSAGVISAYIIFKSFNLKIISIIKSLLKPLNI
ncbi:VanZ family protein [Marinilabiliaceae bacterium ANBcel2]|nr:VanZ family protein [Marinilabiliaceae bacterium ANBcel2]